MTEAEICGSFRRADNKRAQIQIISELTLRPKEEIEEILVRNGYTIPNSKRKGFMKKADEEAKEEEPIGESIIPTAVKIAVTTRADFLENKIETLKAQILQFEAELEELTRFLEGV